MNQVNLFFLNFLISCTISTYIIFEMMRTVYQKTYTSKKVYVMVGFTTVSLWVVINFYFSPIFNTIYSICGIFLISFSLFKAPLKKMVFYNIILLIYLIVIEGISNLIFFQIFNIDRNDMFILLPTIVNQLIVLGTYRIFLLFCQKNELDKKSISECLFLILLVVFEIYILFALSSFASYKEASISLLIIMIGFLILDLYLLYLFKSVSQNHQYEKEKILLRQQSELMNTFYKDIEMKYNQSRKTIHDIKNHVQTLENLMVTGNTELGETYATQVYRKLDNFGYQFKCEDPILMILVNDKLLICKEKKIDFRLKIQECKIDFLMEFDRTTLYSNLLDNAIDACSQMPSEKRKIEFRMHHYNHYLIVRVSNTYNGKLKKEKDHFLSTKAEYRGIGLINIREVVQKYDGNILFETENNLFVVKIIIPLK